MKKCHYCGKEIPSRLNDIKEPTYYFKQVQKDEELCLYWCSWACLEIFMKKKQKGVILDIT